MDCLANFFVRFSPRRVGVFLHSKPKFEKQSDQQSGDNDQAIELTSTTADDDSVKKEQQQQSNDDVDYFQGMEVIKNLPTAQMPDPRVNVGGHVASGLFWYGAFAVFLALLIEFFFLSYSPKQSTSITSMSAIAPVVPITLSVSCTEAAADAASAAVIKDKRTITLSFRSNYNSIDTCKQFSGTQTVTMSKAAGLRTNTFSFSGTISNATLCYVPSSKAFSPLAKNVQAKMDGVTLGVVVGGDGISSSLPNCYVDLQSTVAPKDYSTLERLKAEENKEKSVDPDLRLIRRMNLQTSPPELRLLTVSYFEHNDASAHRSGLPGNKMSLQAGDRYIFPQNYDLEGLRRAGQPSVIAIRLAETGLASQSVDERSVTGFIGEFGTVWRCAELSLFWTGPVVLCIFAYSFLEGGGDGLEQLPEHSKDLLMKTWQPLYATWVVGLVMQKALGLLGKK